MYIRQICEKMQMKEIVAFIVFVDQEKLHDRVIRDPILREKRGLWSTGKSFGWLEELV